MAGGTALRVTGWCSPGGDGAEDEALRDAGSGGCPLGSRIRTSGTATMAHRPRRVRRMGTLHVPVAAGICLPAPRFPTNQDPSWSPPWPIPGPISCVDPGSGVPSCSARARPSGPPALARPLRAALSWSEHGEIWPWTATTALDHLDETGGHGPAWCRTLHKSSRGLGLEDRRLHPHLRRAAVRALRTWRRGGRTWNFPTTGGGTPGWRRGILDGWCGRR